MTCILSSNSFNNLSFAYIAFIKFRIQATSLFQKQLQSAIIG